ncbi:unnamed protein product [Mytilus coruscus]|uniref:B box-type domain-containing protein n=1 Tax=Mytilus coruscus TaxID=42192 RepID=A0A6J8C715_MYTCO|nr:unnamed protein product [Mytilus coruscus]
MGSSPSSSQAQCPVQGVHQAQILIICQRCNKTKVKWRCNECVLQMCDRCGRQDHAVKGHYIIDITTIQVLAVAHDKSIWIGDGNKEGGFRPFASNKALQNVKLEGDKVKIISSFNMKVLDIAVTPTNDILLATREPRLKQIKAGSNKVTDSIYCTELPNINSVHVTKRWQSDSQYDRKVVVFRNTDIINIYRGHPTVNSDRRKFSPTSVVTTPMDNVIVADFENDTIHILNNTVDLMTTYNTWDIIGLSFPQYLAITTERSFSVLYISSFKPKSLFKMVITGC